MGALFGLAGGPAGAAIGAIVGSIVGGVLGGVGGIPLSVIISFRRWLRRHSRQGGYQ